MVRSSMVRMAAARSMAACITGAGRRRSISRVAARGWIWKEQPASGGSTSSKATFSDDASLKPPATPKQMKDGFAWACEFGRTSVVEFLLQKGHGGGREAQA